MTVYRVLVALDRPGNPLVGRYENEKLDERKCASQKRRESSSHMKSIDQKALLCAVKR